MDLTNFECFISFKEQPIYLSSARCEGLSSLSLVILFEPLFRGYDIAMEMLSLATARNLKAVGFGILLPMIH